MSNVRTAVIMVAGLAIGIVAAVLAGQWIFDGVLEHCIQTPAIFGRI